MAKTIGRLAENTPEVGETVSGLLVKKAFTYQIMALDDLLVFVQYSKKISPRGLLLLTLVPLVYWSIG